MRTVFCLATLALASGSALSQEPVPVPYPMPIVPPTLTTLDKRMSALEAKSAEGDKKLDAILAALTRLAPPVALGGAYHSYATGACAGVATVASAGCAGSAATASSSACGSTGTTARRGLVQRIRDRRSGGG